MTHRTVAPPADAFEIRLNWIHEGRRYRLDVVKGESAKDTRRLFQTVEKAPVVRGGDLFVAELYHLEQEYVHNAHNTDRETFERLTGKSIDELLTQAEEIA